MLSIRPAEVSDLDAITDVYNEAIQTTTATFDTEPKTKSEQLRWFESHGPKHPIIVAELDGIVVGWACLTKWPDRAAYSETAETSFYVKQEHRAKGIGRALKKAIIDEARRLGVSLSDHEGGRRKQCEHTLERELWIYPRGNTKGGWPQVW